MLFVVDFLALNQNLAAELLYYGRISKYPYLKVPKR